MNSELLEKNAKLNIPIKISLTDKGVEFFIQNKKKVSQIRLADNDLVYGLSLFDISFEYLHKLIKQNLGFRLYRRALIAENKWRAARYGISGKLIDFGKNEEVEFNLLAGELLDFIDDVVDELGSREEINYIHRILETGTGADRQLAVWDQTNDIHKVVDYIIEETHYGLKL